MPTLQRAETARAQIGDLTLLAERDLAAIWDTADRSSPDAAKRTLEAYYPELVREYGLAATALAADLYDEWREASALTTAYAAMPVADLPVDQLLAQLRNALGSVYQTAPDWDAALDRLVGSLTRNVGNAHRDTIEINARADPVGTRYARHASANACGFCRMLATRSAVYLSEESALQVVGRGTQAKKPLPGEKARGRPAGGIRERGTRRRGEKYHDNCSCTVVPVFPGEQYEEAPYVAQWREMWDGTPQSLDIGRSHST